MHKSKLALTLSLCAMLGACATEPMPSTPQSIVPTVACSENAPATPLPVYPLPPMVETESSLRQYGKDQQAWAIQAIGAYNSERAKRKGTAACLSALRKRGLIN